MSVMGRYPSDLIDAQWALVDPLLSATKGGGCPEAHPRREIVNAILYLVRTGWRQERISATGRKPGVERRSNDSALRRDAAQSSG